MADKKGLKGAVAAGVNSFFSENDQQNTTAIIEEPIRNEATKEPPAENIKPTKKVGKYADILNSIRKPDELPGANITFYMDNELIKAVLDTAKEMNVSRSKLVSKILRQVLLEEE